MGALGTDLACGCVRRPGDVTNHPGLGVGVQPNQDVAPGGCVEHDQGVVPASATAPHREEPGRGRGTAEAGGEQVGGDRAWVVEAASGGSERGVRRDDGAAYHRVAPWT